MLESHLSSKASSNPEAFHLRPQFRAFPLELRPIGAGSAASVSNPSHVSDRHIAPYWAITFTPSWLPCDRARAQSSKHSNVSKTVCRCHDRLISAQGTPASSSVRAPEGVEE
jgi:hypothetical protein